VKSVFILFALFAVFAVVPLGRTEEPFLRPNDVIALVGGEDIVAASEQYGFLELQLQHALPDYRLKIRSLAWEGDTVFEQPRMLNYPNLERQLDEIGATVVMIQFGQMESFAGKERLPAFVDAYEKLISRLRGEKGLRRLVILLPPKFSQGSASDFDAKAEMRRVEFLKKSNADQEAYSLAIRGLADRQSVRYIDITELPDEDVLMQRDGVHLSMTGQAIAAEVICGELRHSEIRKESPGEGVAAAAKLLSIIGKKNRLWDRYRRPQNWAFLAGDRITQPSSHDHVDPTKRWFPEEMKEFVPLIEASEREIWNLAAKLAAEKK
jgi:hypothetical protein